MSGDNKSHRPDQAEGEVNTSARRREWSARNIDDINTRLARGEKP